MINDSNKNLGRLLLFGNNGIDNDGKQELRTLTQMGIAAINLAYRNVDMVASGGNKPAQAGPCACIDRTSAHAPDVVRRYTV